MDSCFTCDSYNKCPFQAEYGNQIGCHEWKPELNIIHGSKSSCYFCDNTHENYDTTNCIYANILTLETSEEVNYCPICGRKLRKEI